MFEDSVATIPSLWASMNSWFTPAVLFVLLNVMIGTIAFTSTLANQTKQQHQENTHTSQSTPTKLDKSPSLLQRVRSINFYTYRSNTSTNATPTHFKSSPDSNTLYDLSNTHHQQQQEQYRHDPIQNASGYVFGHTHQENLQEMNSEEEITNTHYFSNGGEGMGMDSGVEDEPPPRSGGGADEVDDGGDGLQTLDEVYSKLKGGGAHVSRTKSDTEPSSGEVPEKLPAKMRKSASMKSPFGHFETEEVVETRRPATVRERGVARAAEAEQEVDARADDFINRFKHQLKLQRLDSLMRYKELITRGTGK